MLSWGWIRRPFTERKKKSASLGSLIDDEIKAFWENCKSSGGKFFDPRLHHYPIAKKEKL
jgi:hypothetical protein